MGIGIPVCVQCGTKSNPCRCKVVGPTVGFLAFAAAAMVEWPVGAMVYIFRHMKGRRIMAHPAAVVYPSSFNNRSQKPTLALLSAVFLISGTKTVPRRERNTTVNPPPSPSFACLRCLTPSFEHQDHNKLR
ncbi:hypothetical protein E3N88_12329 [Mikania micrantha]|uniref:Uncharacterized protein n=1 Tax=Mikania micrantha TaxID=192012 RepID=A0A5N6P571_9ASTR|nr:hypothetical protein E3N88_12329 [Mikania micrantha]